MSTYERLSEAQKHQYLKSSRETIFAKANDIYTKAKALTSKNVSSFRSQFERLRVLEEGWSDIQEKISLFNATCESTENVLSCQSEEVAFTDLVDQARSYYLILAQAEPRKAPAVETTINEGLLPRISIPTFSGGVESFVEYISLFESLVHNNKGLADINKFQYLRSSLSGEALAVISGFDFLPQNYELAIAALKERYMNVRRLGAIYLKKIMDFSPLATGSHSELQRFLTTHCNSFNALEKLGIPDLLDFMKLQLSLANLDPGSRRGFEEKFSGTSFPAYKDLIHFVTNRSRTAELMTMNPKNSSSKGNRTSSSENKKLTSKQSFVYTIEEDSKSPAEDHCSSCPSSVDSCPQLLSIQKEKKKSAEQKPKTPLKCWNCSGPHRFRSCPQPRSIFCYRCGEANVTSNDCPKCQGNAKGKLG